VLVGDDASLPYDRPPLSKAVSRASANPNIEGALTDYLDIEVRLDEVVRIARSRDDGGDVRRGTIESPTCPSPLEATADTYHLATGNTPAAHRLRAVALRDVSYPARASVIVAPADRRRWVAHAALERGCRVTGLEYHAPRSRRRFGTRSVPFRPEWWDGADLRTGLRVAAVERDGRHRAER